MPNPLAYLMLALWPVVTIVLFRRQPADRALILSLMVGYLFLPEFPAAFDFPLLPPISKHTIPALAAFGVCLVKFGPQGLLMPQSPLARVLLAVFIFVPLVTTVTNTEPVYYGQVGLPGLGIKDAIALMLQQVMLVMPFLLARQYLAEPGSQRYFLQALMVFGLIYSLPMLVELRLSPQLNNWIYGYYQHSFAQSVRGGGYRPVVFLYHGLWVSFFIMTAAVAAFALWRQDSRLNTPKTLLCALYLLLVLVASKSLGALILAAVALPCLLFLSRMMQIRIALLIGLLAIAYPVMKGANIIPEDRILAAAASIEDERSRSLDFRFQQERILLDRANRKPVFGWGSWGRNHILDPVSGAILTVTDGRWIIAIGVYGWIGFLAEFGLLVTPFFLLWRGSRELGADRLSPYIAPMSLILAVNVADLIPNATLTPLTWLLAGALTGYAERMKVAPSLSQVAPGTPSTPKREVEWQSIM